MKRNGRFRWDVYGILRSRIIKETEQALALGLQFPERTRRIPTIETGNGEFQPAFAARYWQEVLDLDEVFITGAWTTR
jgi:hypothetical protein